MKIVTIVIIVLMMMTAASHAGGCKKLHQKNAALAKELENQRNQVKELQSKIASLTTSPSQEKTCTAVGVANKDKIPDEKITTSDDSYSDAHDGRLNGESAWCVPIVSNDYTLDFLEVDMGAVHTVCAVATQGKAGGAYVTSYKVSFRTDGEFFFKDYKDKNSYVAKVFRGNEDGDTIIQNALADPVEARYVRFYPVTISSLPCMRVEIFVQ